MAPGVTGLVSDTREAGQSIAVGLMVSGGATKPAAPCWP